MDKSQIRHAATVILVRDPAGDAQVLMGQRGAKAVFMPNKFVFPGGAVDAEDAAIPMAGGVPHPCAGRLREDARGGVLPGLAAAAVRELWEETGLRLSRPGAWPDPPEDWRSFAEGGHRPDASALSFVFRAVTPPGRPRRFDARFFLADAAAVTGDPDDFSAASDELSHLQWIRLPKVRDYQLPFITEVVLAEVSAALPELGPPKTVPFFDNGAEESLFRRLAGRSPLQQG